MQPLSAREVYQQLRDTAQGIHSLQLAQHLDSGLLQITLEGWCLTLDFSDRHLHHCQRCRAPDGREWNLETQRYGTDPVSLLSTWELAQIERLLLQACDSDFSM
ncbi:hypothetical protein K5D34_20045 [Pseudomonas cichorii]|uniref:DUF7693 domain-containing protein n=2 Tax=Pseudomonas syringae group TaxID=136849 RepID=A0A3M4WGB0_PSECI|nr:MULTISPECIES: hypothetical protein [Pseudomonas syringae group]MBX8492643.1 hypothetical protein [Pseudomonas cichorii]MBX8502224.1 hypothetical protein [Pseudomonas lijiangensis]MBX8507059.1 hypothetical protein [Pseudomonas lijiangensis]MBX8511978.1 hypothetical protein [Pseudomonas cichorii]MBX8521869.1 hypothetical protein [Pseudomonas cichorii]